MGSVGADVDITLAGQHEFQASSTGLPNVSEKDHQQQVAGWQRLGCLSKMQLFPSIRLPVLCADFVWIKCVVLGTRTCTLGLLLWLPGEPSG